MLAHVTSFGRNPRVSPDFLAYPAPKACMHVHGIRVPRRLGVARSLESQSSAGLRMQPYPRAPDLVWPGHLHGRGRLSARAMDTGFPAVVWRLCLGPACAWVSVSGTPPALAGVLGGCVSVRFVVSPLFSPLGFVVFALGLGFRPAPHLSWLGFRDVRGCVHTPPAPRRPGFWCAVWAWVLGSGFGLRPASPWGGVVGPCVRSCVCPACPRPSWGAACVGGVCGCCRSWGVPPPPPLWFFFGGGGFVVSVAGCPALGSRRLCPPIPSLPGRVVCCLCFFLSQRGVCPRVLGVPSPGGPLFSASCCQFWLSGPPAPLWGVLSSVPSGWGVWPPLVVLVGGVVAVGRSRPPPPPPVVFFLGGGGLPVPPSAFPGLAHALVGILCGFPICCWWLHFARPCPGPMDRVGYVHVGLGAPSCRVRFWLCRPGGCASGFVWPRVSRVLSSPRCRF